MFRLQAMRPTVWLLLVLLVANGLSVACRRESHAFTNRLINEASPYLQQHAHNPVDWYPWGQEAFDKARREDRAIFLSIGYSTCHWCHVMEEESFSNPEIAALLNEHFVSIKVDREERPDLDRLYMNYVIGVSEGGWPMSLFLTPDLKPFFGANYLPPDDHDGDPGFRTVLHNVATLWRTQRSQALQAAAAGTQALEERSRATTGNVVLDPEQVFTSTFNAFVATYDAVSGGFGGAPKFPRPVVLTFLLHYYARTGNQRALDMTAGSLRGMARGGIHDQLGGGFHRYATDREWRVPHFEKMLYDQALLAGTYVDAYQATGDREFEQVARSTLEYALRELRDPSGGFHSAEDADSIDAATGKVEEGAYYLWTRREFDRVLGTDAELAAYYFDVAPTGAHALTTGRSMAEVAARFGRPARQAAAAIDNARRSLLRTRLARSRPPQDDKILVAWNGLMMSALSRAAQVFDEPRYLQAARTQAAFIESRMFDAESSTLQRRYRAGDADVDGLLEDYAYLIQGLLDLYEASLEPRWLSWAVRLQEKQDRLFWDSEGGAYFSTQGDAANMLTRVKEEYDGAEPAANSVSAMNLLRLWKMTARGQWRTYADSTFRALAPRVTRSGAALPQLLAALDFLRSKPREIVIAGRRDAADTRALLRIVHRRYMPNKVLLLAESGASRQQMKELVPFMDGMNARDGRATIYVCENYACRLPTTDPHVAARLLAE